MILQQWLSRAWRTARRCGICGERRTGGRATAARDPRRALATPHSSAAGQARLLQGQDPAAVAADPRRGDQELGLPPPLDCAGDRGLPAGAARARSRGGGTAASAAARPAKGRTWVTRSGVHVDRIASAWLIRRFIDPDARFRFVAPEEHQPAPGELRFDMFEAEYTHEGDRCTFETLLARFGLVDPALSAIAELVHDIDCKDGKFARGETAGVERGIAGIVRRHASDAARVEHGEIGRA